MQFDPFNPHIRHRGGKDRSAIGFLAHVTNETLNDLPVDALDLDFGQVGSAAFFIFANIAHVVSNILTTTKRVQPYSLKIETVNPPVRPAQNVDGLLRANRSEYF